MGLFTKLGLVEEVQSDNYDDIVEESYVVEEEPVEAELESVNTNTLIEDVYIQNGLADKARSIFKVEELIASLPENMATETKRNSVIAILSSFGLTATDVVVDGEARLKVLASIKEQIEADAKNVVSEKETQIEELKQAIESLTDEIATEQKTSKLSGEIITDEVSKVENLVKFIGGVN